VESRLWKAYENCRQARQDAAHLLFQDWHRPGSRTAISPKCLHSEKQEFRFLLLLCPSPRAAAPLCLPLFTRKKRGFLPLAFALGCEAFAFLVWEALEGKRIAKGKLLKGKEWLKKG
jgi:hypothetical protein